MPLPVNLHGEPEFLAIEIKDVGPHWMLASEAEALEALSPDLTPQQHFRQAHRAAEFASATDGAFGRVHGESLCPSSVGGSPLPPLRGDFPQGGKIRAGG